MSTGAGCSTEQILQQLLLGQLEEEQMERVALHVETCSACTAMLDRLEASDVLVEAMQSSQLVIEPPKGRFVQDLIERFCGILFRGDVSPTSDASLGQTAAGDASSEATQELCQFLAPAQEPDEIGRLGGYRVLEQIGSGGMGVVYRAEEMKLRRLVALKVMRPTLAKDDAARQRFLREARAAARIVHDNILGVFDADEVDGVPFIAMHLLRGETLDKRMKREGRLPIADVIQIGRQIAEGLGAAHECGLIHRDIKPSNIWLEPTGTGTGRVADSAGNDDSVHEAQDSRAKILDFGLARILEGDVQLTQTGVIMGTPAYMAPEQAKGEEIDLRADLFSLGCILYVLATGQRAFPGKNTMAVFRSLELHEPESPHNTNRDVPVALSNLIMRLLAKDPEKRCGSAREVAESLDAIAIVRPKTASVTGQHIARKKAIIVSVVVGVLGLVAFVAGPTLLTRWSNQDSSTKKDEITQSGSSHSQSTSRSTPFLCSFAPPVNYKVGDGPYRVAVGDFNHDRHQDLAVSNSRSDSVSILLGNGDGTFKPTKNYLCGAEPFMLAVHDMNGDGNQDLVVAKRASNTVGVMAGDGKGAFEAPVNYPCGPRPRGLALGDFNADGVADVVVANAVKLPDSSVTVLLGKKDGTLGNMKLNACGGSPISVAVTDFNADGKQDLVTSNSDGNSVSVLLGDGKGNFQPAVDYTVGSGPGAVVVGDFNGDSRPDIVVENFGTNDVTILLGQGDGTFQAAVPYLAHLSPGGLATGDINGDDRLDLVVANHNSVDLSVLLGRGDGTFQPAKNFGVPGAMPAGVAVADFNEDGRADIVVVNWSSKDISLLLNQAPDWHFDVVAPIDRGLFVTRYLLVSITAMDQSNVRDSNYKGTVQFSSSDPRAELPEDYTFTSEDQGSRDVRVWFKTAGPQTVTVVDSETQTRLGWATLRMFAGDIKQLEVRVPSRASVGASIDAEVVALDEYGNESEFTGSVHFTSSDALAVLPPDYTFDKDENGKHTFQVTFRTPGRRTLTVTYSAIVGNATIAVEPATDMP